jgi:hypothetical protein
MNERRESTCVTPALSILNRLRDQFPVEMARDEAGCNEISSELHGVEGVELGRAGGFFEDLVDPRLQCHVEGLKKVFKQQRE